MQTHEAQAPAAKANGNDHERSDAHVAPLVTFVIGMTIMCVLAFWSMKALLDWADANPAKHVGNDEHPLAVERVIPPEPRLEVMRTLEGGTLVLSGDRQDGSAMYTSQDRHKLEARARSQLGTYGWIDQQAGITHIPIARAKELVLEGKLPVSGKQP